MNAHHLPETFTWQGYLDWVEETTPEVPLREVETLFTWACANGWVRPLHLDENDNMVFECVPEAIERPVKMIVVKKGLN